MLQILLSRSSNIEKRINNTEELIKYFIAIYMDDDFPPIIEGLKANCKFSKHEITMKKLNRVKTSD